MADEKINQPKSNLALIIIITAVVTALIVGGILFFYFKYSQLKDSLESQGTTPTSATTQTPTSNTPSVSPSTVVDNYMKATIGTIPGGQVNDELAKTYMTDALKAQYTDSSYPKTSYGIVNQNWPHQVRIDGEENPGSTATVKTSGDWSAVSPNWENFCDFTLVNENGQWKISQISTHLYDNEYRIPEGF